MNKYFQDLATMYESVFKVEKLGKDSFTIRLLDTKAICGVFDTEISAIKAMPALGFNFSRGYVQADCLKKRPEHASRPQFNKQRR